MKDKPNIDDRNKLADIKLKQAQAKDIPIKLKIEEDRLLNDKQKTNLDKIVQIGRLLESYNIESMEGRLDVVKFTKVFDEQEEKRLKLKLFQLLRVI